MTPGLYLSPLNVAHHLDATGVVAWGTYAKHLLSGSLALCGPAICHVG